MRGCSKLNKGGKLVYGLSPALIDLLQNEFCSFLPPNPRTTLRKKREMGSRKGEGGSGSEGGGGRGNLIHDNSKLSK